jgi:hypothetical protein
MEVIIDDGTIRYDEINWEVMNKAKEWYTFQVDDFSSVRGETWRARRFKRDEWSVETITRTVLTSTETHFKIHAELDAWENDERIFSRNWQYEVPRDHV